MADLQEGWAFVWIGLLNIILNAGARSLPSKPPLMRSLLIAAASAFVLLTAFTTRKKNKPKLPEEFVYIPQGSMFIDTADIPPGHCDPGGYSVFFMSFYISKYEITNNRYREFINEILPKLGEHEKESILCDTAAWERSIERGDAMKHYYYNHPAYKEYPVVNITREGAMRYCKWLQEKIQAGNPDFEITVKLPSRFHWTYAAMGGRGQAIYPWGNYYLRNKKGEFMCNFRKVGDQAITRNRQTGAPQVNEPPMYPGGLSDRSYTAAVKSFYPNDFGLYNMCGNVAEMVSEENVCMGGSWNDYGGDVSTRSEATFQEAVPTVGFRPMIWVVEKGK